MIVAHNGTSLVADTGYKPVPQRLSLDTS